MSLIVAAVALSATVLAPGALPSPSHAPAAVTVHSSDYGRIPFDGRGFALFLRQNVCEFGGRWLVPNGTRLQ